MPWVLLVFLCVRGQTTGSSASTCTDSLRNGNETDVDCGGGTCALCATGGSCASAADCLSSNCTALSCAGLATTCTNGAMDAGETGEDCGGACAPCLAGEACSVATDCVDRVCTNSTCADSTCSDGVWNGGETDIDCGGGICAPCAIGQQCNSFEDCSGSCVSKRCDVLSCPPPPLTAAVSTLCSRTQRGTDGQRCYFICTLGYEGSAVYLTCSGGNWTGTYPTCTLEDDTPPSDTGEPPATTYACSLDLHQPLGFEFKWNWEEDHVSIRMQAHTPNGYIAVGLHRVSAPQFMLGNIHTDDHPGSSPGWWMDVWIADRNYVVDSFMQSDNRYRPLFDNQEDLTNVNRYVVDGQLTVDFERLLMTDDFREDFEIEPETEYVLVYACHPDSGLVSATAEPPRHETHTDNTNPCYGQKTIKFGNCDPVEASTSGFESPDGKYNVKWSVDESTITFKLEVSTRGWVSIGWSVDTPPHEESDMYVGWVQNDGSVVLLDMWSTELDIPEEDTLRGGTNDVREVVGSESAGITKIAFTRDFYTSDDSDVNIEDVTITLQWAYGASDGSGTSFEIHTANTRGYAKANFLSEDISESVFEILFPDPGACVCWVVFFVLYLYATVRWIFKLYKHVERRKRRNTIIMENEPSATRPPPERESPTYKPPSTIYQGSQRVEGMDHADNSGGIHHNTRDVEMQQTQADSEFTELQVDEDCSVAELQEEEDVPTVGDQVVVSSLEATAPGTGRGVVRYCGPAQGDDARARPGCWLGVELEGAYGRNNGTINGQFYFACEGDHGVFCRPTAVAATEQTYERVAAEAPLALVPSPSTSGRVRQGGRGAAAGRASGGRGRGDTGCGGRGGSRGRGSSAERGRGRGDTVFLLPTSPEKAAGSGVGRAVRGATHRRVPKSQVTTLDVGVAAFYVFINLGFALIWPRKSWNTASSFGHLVSANALLSALPATRNSVLVWALGIPFDKTITYHRWLGRWTLIVLLLHGLLYSVTWLKASVFIPQLTAFYNLMGLFGTLACAFLFVTSIEWMRRQHFEVFFYSHLAYILFFLFGSLHTDAFWPYAIIAAVFFLVDRCIRFAWGVFPRASTLAIEGDIVQVRIPKHSLSSYRLGQYVFLNFPEYSLLQWHPFTLANAPGEDELLVYIKALGGYTRKLVDCAQSGQQAKVRVDGPYGQWPFNVDRYPSVVVIGGGIGVTPCIALLRHMFRINEGSGTKPQQRFVQQVTFVWSCRNPEMYRLFADNITEAKKKSGTDNYPLFVPRIHITKGDSSVVEGAVDGRPDIHNILCSLSATSKFVRHAVIACGTRAMVNDAWDATTALSRNMVGFDFHHETFEF